MWHEVFVEILEANYERLKKKNPRYSRRAFSKKIEISNGTLSDVTKFKTKLTPERAFEILRKLELNERERTRMFTLLGHAEEVSKFYSPESDVSILADWKYRVVYYSFDLNDKFVSAELISQRTNIPLAEVEEKIDRLLKAKLIEVDANGILRKDSGILKTSDGVASDYVKIVHLGNLVPLKNAIENLSVETRDITSVTFAGNRKKLESVRREIRNLYEKVLGTMDTSSNDEVFEMTIALFPLAQPREVK